MPSINRLLFSTKQFYNLKTTVKLGSRVFVRFTKIRPQIKKYCLVSLLPLSYSSKLQGSNHGTIETPLTDKLSNNQHRARLTEWISSLYTIARLLSRGLRLLATFTPVLLVYPVLTLRHSWKLLWFDIVTKAIEISGPVYIKFGQWASTRRDLFPSELCDKLEKLQTKTTPHTWEYTEWELERAYGPNWRNIFKKFESHQPVGSGCVAQVYKAWISYEETLLEDEGNKTSEKWQFRWPFNSHDGKSANLPMIPVAVKVLHPGITNAFEQDLALMKFGVRFLTSIVPNLKWINLNACLEEFAAVMSAQIDLRVEAENLSRFGRNFALIPHVHFPKPFHHLVHSSVLVESFEDGKSIVQFIRSLRGSDGDLESKKQILAKLGAHALLKMIFVDNFVHGDLHPGNILVQEENSTEVDGMPCPAFHENSDPFSAFIALELGDQLFHWSLFDHESVDGRRCNQLSLVILDCGIVSLLRRDKLMEVFRETFRAIISGQGEKVGDLFLKTSEHECQNEDEFRRGMDHIVRTARQQSITLAKIDVSSLMQQVFGLLIKHHVRLESEFSAVVLAVMILEGLGRSLDPGLDLLQEAKPFLLAGK